MPFIVPLAIIVIELFPVPPPFSFFIYPPPPFLATPTVIAPYIDAGTSAVLFRTFLAFRAQFVSPFCGVDSAILGKTIGTFGLILRSLQAFNHPALDHRDD